MRIRNLIFLLCVWTIRATLQNCVEGNHCDICLDRLTCLIAKPRNCISPNGTAVQCPQKCEQCQFVGGNVVCTRCLPDLYLNPQRKTCGPCSKDSCARCEHPTSSNCTDCHVGQYLRGGNCHSCQISQCYRCSSDQSCPPCPSEIDGYYSKSSGMACLPCPQSHCKSCLNVDTCLSCVQGFYVEQGTCHQCNIDNCRNCTFVHPQVLCERCVQGFGKDQNQQCKKCPQRCYMCVTSDTCTSCEAGSIVNQQGKCQACGIPYCGDCPEDRNTCTSCVQNQRPSNNGNCPQCPNRQGPKDGACASCQDSHCNKCSHHVSQCESCDSGYRTSQNGCVKCPMNCHTCNEQNECLSCGNAAKNQPPRNNSKECGNCFFSSPCKSCQDNYFKCTQCEPKTGLSKQQNQQIYCEKCGGESNPDLGCVNCNDNYQICTQCQKGKGLKDGRCYSCHQNCQECQSDKDKCQVCKITFYVDSGQCKKCQDHCLECRSQTDCITCGMIQPFSLNRSAENGACGDCFYSNCDQCTQNYFICSKCDEQYGLHPETNDFVSCFKCEDEVVNCKSCAKNYSYCVQCKNDKCVNNGLCVDCDQNNTCRKQKDFKCVQCTDHYYLENETCKKCPQYCLHCESQVKCKQCGLFDRYVELNQLGQCPQKCYPKNCLECQTNYFQCSKCEQKYGIKREETTNPNPDLNCAKCQEKCLNCSQNYLQCVSCVDGFAPLNGVCTSCQTVNQNCIKCSEDINKCQKCRNDSILYEQKCIDCSDKCENCTFTGNAICGCHNGFDVVDGKLVEKCGDFLVFDLPCDNEPDIPFDGCNNNCTLMEGFECMCVDRKSVCSYSREVSFSFLSLTEEAMNHYRVDLKVKPFLDAFKRTSLEKIKNLFQMQKHPEFSVQEVKYENGVFNISFKILQRPQSRSLSLEFTPSEKINERYFATPEVNMQFPYEDSFIHFYSASSVAITSIVSLVNWAVVVTSWIGFVLTLFTKHLAGIEAIFVVQFAWVSFLWMHTDFIRPFASFLPLKYSTGFNVDVVKMKSEKTDSDEPPLISKFEMNSEMFVNNFSFSIILFAISVLAILIIILREIVLFAKNKHQKQNDDKDYKEMKNTQKDKMVKKKKVKITMKGINENKNEGKFDVFQKLEKYDNCLHIIICVTFLSLVNFVNCTVISVQSDTFTDIVNVVAFALSCCFIVFMLLWFYFEPCSFFFFRVPFKLETFSQNHYFLKMPMLVVSTVLLCVTADITLVSLIPLALLFAYVLWRMPHIDSKNNVRSLLNLLTMCVFVGFKTFVQKVDKFKLSDVQTYIFLLICSSLLLIVTITGILFQIHALWHKFQQKRSKQISSSSEQKLFHQILNSLVSTDVQCKMKVLDNQNYFKNKIHPKQSLLSYTYQMKELLKNKKVKEDSFKIENKDYTYDIETVTWQANPLNEPDQKTTVDKNRMREQLLKQKSENVQFSHISLNKQEEIVNRVIGDQSNYIQYQAVVSKTQTKFLNQASEFEEMEQLAQKDREQIRGELEKVEEGAGEGKGGLTKRIFVQVYEGIEESRGK